MRILSAFLLSAICLFAQPVAEVDGVTLSATDVRHLIASAPAAGRQVAQTDPESFLRQTFGYEKLAAEAEAAGYDKKSPYAERIEWNRNQVLTQAFINEKTSSFDITDAEIKAYYDRNPLKVGSAQLQLIFLASPKAEGLVKIKAASLVRQARAGIDFSTLAKKYSEHGASAAKGGDYGEFNAESKFPPEIFKAVQKLKAGEISAPLYHDGSYYIFRVASWDMKSLDGAREFIKGRISENKLDQLMAENRDKVTVIIIDPVYFRAAMSRLAGAVDGAALDMPNLSAVVAELNGQAITGDDFGKILRGMSGTVQMQALQNPEGALKQYGLVQSLTRLALAAGLDKKHPYDDQLRGARTSDMYNAAIRERDNRTTVAPEVVEKAFAERADQYHVADISAMWIRFGDENQAKAKVQEVQAQLKSGANFKEVATKYSDPGLPNIGQQNAANPGLPPVIKNAIFTAKTGDVTEPIRMPNAYYIFKIDSIRHKTLEEVRPALYDELRGDILNRYLTGLFEGIKVKVLDEAAFKKVAAE